ncbi:MAG: hypothetical protein MJ240_00510 [Kiritimatiellae bacterium]|nr:hypothetical protein [Kiritimatiellia bacterium]
MKRLFAFAAVLMAAHFGQAKIYYWISSGDCDWDDPKNWSLTGGAAGSDGTLPGPADSVQIAASANCAIMLNGDRQVAKFEMVWATASAPTACTLKGTGTLTVGGNGENTSLQVNSYRTLVLDGPDVYCADGVQYCEGGTMIIKKGTYTPVTHYLKTAPGRVVIDGGTAAAQGTRSFVLQNGWSSDEAQPAVCFIDLKSGTLATRVALNSGTFTMSGGVWDRTAYTTDIVTSHRRANMFFNILGGEKIVFADCDSTPFPPDESFWKVHELVSISRTRNVALRDSDGPLDFGILQAPKTTVNIANNVQLHGERLDVANFALGVGAHEVVFDVEQLRANLSGTMVTFTANKDLLPLHMVSPKAVSLEMANAGTMKIFAGLTQPNCDIFWNLRKGIAFDTTAKSDGTSAANYYLGAPLFEPGATLDVQGVGGVTIAFNSYTNVPNGRSCQDGLSNRLARVSVTGGASLGFENWAWLNRDYALRTDKLTLGAASRLSLLSATYAHFEALEADLDPTAQIEIGTPDMANSNFSPAALTLGPQHVNDFQTPETRPTVKLTTAGADASWECEWINGMPVVWRKDVPQRANCLMTRVNMSKWRGSVDGNWTNAENWLIDTDKTQAEDPLQQAMVFDGGYTNTRVTVNENVKAYQIRVYNYTAPVAFVGTGTIELGCASRENIAATAWDVNNAIVSSSENPLIFDVPVKLADEVAAPRYFTVNGGGRSYIAFMKDVAAGQVASFKGDVLIGGTVTAENFLFNEQGSSFPARRTRFAVLPGAQATATAQTWLQSGGNVTIEVYSNGVFMVANPNSACFWGHNTKRMPIKVQAGGRFDCRCALGGSTEVSFEGAGEVRLHDTGGMATEDYPVTIGGSVTVAVENFTAGHPLVFTGSPVWAATADWTYDLAPVTLPDGETLTVDTADLDSGAGHVATIGTAVSAAKLVKRGAGTLVLGAAGNVVEELDLQKGTLVIAAPLSVAKVSCAEDAMLAPASGLVSSRAWTTVLQMPEGAAVAGDLKFPSSLRLQVVEDGGEVKYQVRRIAGLTVNIR